MFETSEIGFFQKNFKKVADTEIPPPLFSRLRDILFYKLNYELDEVIPKYLSLLFAKKTTLLRLYWKIRMVC